jgi:7-cyano-7-deazaguanine synthase
MKSTVVPNRNMILLSLAIGYAVSENAQAVYYGAHSGDHAIYPDCRPEFVRQMNVVSKLANYEPVEVVAPYLDVDKNAILADGLKMGLDYSNTWTCYNGRDKACGKCGACIERLEAFAANKQSDPLSYE